jgi:serine/threonine-protein kinase
MLFCPLCRIVLGTGETVCPRDGHSPLEREPQRVPPTIAARFALVEPFADGESGSLYLVDDKQTGRRGILKVLRVSTAGTVSERGRLKRELMKQATLTHPALVVPLATGEADNCMWLFREWIDGVSLSVKLARSGALSLPEALSIAAQIASGLDELHRAGLLMRDLSPGHVLTTAQPSGRPKVCLIDAGVTSRISVATPGEITGKPGYISPEHARGKLISFRSDLYSLGVVLYEMLTGQPLTQGSAEERLEMQRSREAPALRVAVPSSVAALVAQLLVKEPRDRPFSAQQVRRALEPFLPEDTSNTRREQTAAFVIGERTRMTVETKGSGTLRPAPKNTLVGLVVPMPGGDRAEALVANTSRNSAAQPTRSKEATQELSTWDVHSMDPAPPPFRRDGDPTTPLSPTDLVPSSLPRRVKTSAPPPLPDLAKSSEHEVKVSDAAPQPASVEKSAAKAVDGPMLASATSSPSLVQPAPIIEFDLNHDEFAETMPMMRNELPLEPVAVVQSSVVQSSVVQSSVVQSPVVQSPVVQSSVVQSPVVQSPVVQSVIVPEPTVPEESAPSPDVSARPASIKATIHGMSAPALKEPSLEPTKVEVPPTRIFDEPNVIAEAPPTPVVGRSPNALQLRTPVLVLAGVTGFCAIATATGVAGAWLWTRASTPTPVASPTAPVQPASEPMGSGPSQSAGLAPGQQAAHPEPTPQAPTPADIPAPVAEAAEIPPPVAEAAEIPAPVAEAEEASTEETTAAAAAPEAAFVTSPAPAPVASTPAAPAQTASTPSTGRTSGRRAQVSSTERASRAAAATPAARTFEQLRDDARAAFQARRFADAARAYEQAANMRPRDAAAWAGLGAARLQGGNARGALEAYRQAVTIEPRNPRYHVSMGRAFAASGDRTRARQAFTHALSIDPNNREARTQLEQL